LQSDTVHWSVKIGFGGERIQGPALVNDHDREYFSYRSTTARQVVAARTFVSILFESRAQGRIPILRHRGGGEGAKSLIDRPPTIFKFYRASQLILRER
jgi:hypothetical protein